MASTGNTWREREWWSLGGIYDNRHTHKREIALHHAHKNSPLKKFPFNIFSTVICYPGFCFTAMLIVECTYRKKCVCKRERERAKKTTKSRATGRPSRHLLTKLRLTGKWAAGTAGCALVARRGGPTARDLTERKKNKLKYREREGERERERGREREKESVLG